MDDIRRRFVCRDKTKLVSTLLLGFGRSCRCEELLLLLFRVFGCAFVFICLGRVLACTVRISSDAIRAKLPGFFFGVLVILSPRRGAVVAFSGASLCVRVGVLLGFSLHF